MRHVWSGLLSVAVVCGLFGPALAQEKPDVHPWSVSLSPGWLNFEGDEEVKDSFLMSLGVGYDVDENWTIEGVLDVVPTLDENFRTQWDTGERVSRLEEETKPGVHETSSVRLSLDALYHVWPHERVDPYLAAGAGVIWYEDDFDQELEPSARGGGGCAYHFSDEWAVRADVRVLASGVDPEVNLVTSAGVTWTPGAARPPHGAPAEAVADADLDGVTDAEEAKYGTNPKLPDTDFDGLSDGREVHQTQTNPLNRDTDGGGVSDGHEVMEDRTNPLAKDDDLQMFELQMNFDKDKWDIRSEYFGELDAIARILAQNPESKARIEGHVEKKKDSLERHEMDLTQKRAEAIEDYFRKNGKIARNRLESKGYGFSRPKAENDPVKGNPANNRMEIYIRGAKKAAAMGAKPVAVKPADK